MRSCVTQGDSVPTGEDPSFCEPLTLEQKTSTIGGASGKVSLWMQWMLPKMTVKLYAPDPTSKTGKVIFSTAIRASLCVSISIIYTQHITDASDSRTLDLGQGYISHEIMHFKRD